MTLFFRKLSARKRLIVAGLCFVLLVVAFYTAFELASDRIVSQYALAAETRNSVKHAYAAARIYRAIRWVVMNKESAGQIVLFMGKLNEYAEQYVKRGKIDSDGELRKDFSNNWAGVVAAEWCMNQNPPRDIAPVIALLAERKKLVIKREEINAVTQGKIQKVDRQWLWFVNNQTGIEADILEALTQSHGTEK